MNYPSRDSSRKDQRTLPPDGPASAAEQVWLVLARRAYDEPLKQVGTVETNDRDLAMVYARSIYDEFAWIEMAIVPRDALTPVIDS